MKIKSWIFKAAGGCRVVVKSQLDEDELDILSSLKPSSNKELSPLELLPLSVNVGIPPKKVFAGTNLGNDKIDYIGSVGAGTLTIDLTEPIDFWVDAYLDDPTAVEKFKEGVLSPLLNALKELEGSTDYEENEISFENRK